MKPIERIRERFPSLLKMDGYDECIAGVVTRFDNRAILCYDIARILKRHVRDGMSVIEAQEYFDFNQMGSWMGKRTPCFIDLVKDIP